MNYDKQICTLINIKIQFGPTRFINEGKCTHMMIVYYDRTPAMGGNQRIGSLIPAFKRQMYK